MDKTYCVYLQSDLASYAVSIADKYHGEMNDDGTGVTEIAFRNSADREKYMLSIQKAVRADLKERRRAYLERK